MGAMVIALGIAVLFQFIILRIKWNRGNYADVMVDVAMLTLLNIIFGGSILGVVSATAGSTLISLYLIWYPIKIFDDETLESFKPQSSSKTATNDRTPAENITARFDNLFT